MKLNNIYENLVYDKKNEIVNEIFNDENITISRIASFNQTTDWMEDERREIAILLEGEAEIQFVDHKKILKKGDMIYINPLLKHRVINISPNGLWLCIYFN